MTLGIIWLKHLANDSYSFTKTYIVEETFWNSTYVCFEFFSFKKQNKKKIIEFLIDYS